MSRFKHGLFASPGRILRCLRAAQNGLDGSQSPVSSRGRAAAWSVVCVACVAPAFAQEGAPDASVLTAEGLVAEVLQRNPSLEAQRDAVSAAAAHIKTAGALDDPMLSVGVAPRTIGSAIGTRGNVGVSQALPWWGTRNARAAAAQAMADAASEDEQSLALRLRAMAQNAFAEWRYVHTALEVNRHHQGLYTELREAAKGRFAAGVAPEQDVLQADIERTILRREALELAQRQLAVQAGINALLNRPANAPVAPPGPLPPVGDLPPLAALESFALDRHPDLRQLEFQERVASEQQTLAEKSRYPNLVISVGYDSMWDNTLQRPLVGMSINLPLDQGKRAAEIDAARASAHRAQASLADLRAHLDGDIATAYAAVQETRQSLTLYQQQLIPLAVSSLAVARSEYAAGRSDFLYVIKADQSAVDAELGLARTEAELFIHLAELGRLAGTSLPIEIPPAGRTFNAEDAPHDR